MTTLDERVQAALNNHTDSTWEDLLRLYEVDPESFYELACGGAGANAREAVRNLAALASVVRAAVHESYEFASNDHGAALVTRSGKTEFIPQQLVPMVRQFLRKVEGKGDSKTAGKDYEGTTVSEAEVRFKLGDRSTWDAEHKRIQSQLALQPLILRISDEEVEHLKSQPPYVTYGLLNCARKTVLAPRSVFRGLKRGDDCPADLHDGWAFCGKPRQAFDNQGNSFDAPQGMVYLVFANDDGFVFDWDWVQEDSEEEGSPINSQLRFGDPHVLQRDAVFDVPKGLQPGAFDATKACYSSKGDCIFCYMSDEVSFAERINADLTVFKSIGPKQHTGFKVKNVRRIVEVDRGIVIRDDPAIEVSVETVLLASRRLHPESSIDIYNVLIELRKKVGEPPKVRLPQRPTQLAMQ